MKRMWGTLALMLLVALTLALARADEPQDLRSSYDIRVTLDPTTQTLMGWQEIDYVNDTDGPIDEVLFCLIGNWGAEPNPYLHPAWLDPQYVAGFDPTWTRIHQVTDGADRPLPHRFEPFPAALQTYSLTDGLLVVELPSALAPGDRVTLRLQFETRFARAIAMDNCVYRDTYVWRFGWNPIAVPRAARGGAFALPAAGYRVKLTVPQTYRVFGGADHQAMTESVAGLATYELTTDRPARSIPLVIGPDLRAVSSSWDGVMLQAVYLPGGETFARVALSYARDILAYYSTRYGPLEYKRVVLVENPTPGFFGLAADGMILVGRSMARLKDMPALGMYDRLIEYLFAHEAAHLWWGIGIGADFNAENWISEGFAEYLSIGYFEDKYGAFEPNLLSHLGDGLVEDVIRDELGYLNLRQHFAEARYVDLLRLGFDEAIVKPMIEVEYLNGLTVRTYSKGYLVLRALDSLVGRETLQAVLVEANAAGRGQTFTVKAFADLAEEISGIDLSRFFADWLFGAATIDIAVDGFDTTETEDGFTTTIHLGRSGPDLPVTVRATLADGSVVDTRWTPDCCAADAVVLNSGSPVRSVHVDPSEMLPDANRFNNHFPRRILVDHPFRSEDALDIGVPLDAYVIRLSPLGLSGGFRNDHAWSLAAMPHLDDATSVDLADALASWDVTGFFAADVNRNLSFSAAASVAALDVRDGSGDIDARFSVHTRVFTQPQTGTAGTYWYPTTRLDLTLGARGALPRPIPYLAFDVLRSDALALHMDNAFELKLGVPGFATDPFATIGWNGAKRVRLGPLLYVDLGASAGASLLEALPTQFMFSMDRLHAFALPPYGHFQLYARAELRFPPLVRDAGYAILNLTRAEDVTAGAFLHGGRTWGGCDRVCESGIRIEAGASLTVRFDAVLGSTIDVTFGYAHPLVGPDGAARVFVEFGAGM